MSAALKGQSGQALSAGLLLAAAGGLAWLLYADLGRVVAQRSRHTHALDAAAYSGAVVQARALNLLAYLNRSQLGHQVAMAHLVTLGAWSAFGETQAAQVSIGNPPAHVIGMFFGAAHAVAYQAAARAAGMAGPASGTALLSQAYQAHARVVSQVLSQAQLAVVAGVPEARRAAMQQVMDLHVASWPSAADPTQAAHLQVLEDGWPALLQRQSAREGLRHVAELADLYPLLHPRDHTVSSLTPVDIRCPWLRHQLRRRGRSGMDAQGRWEAVDTLAFHAVRSNQWIGCYYREYPMAWGWNTSSGSDLQEPHVQEPPANFSQQDFWRWVQSATDWDLLSVSGNPLTSSQAVVARTRWRGGGLIPHYDLSTVQGQPLGRFVVSLQRRSGALDYRSHSAAEVYFSRPQPRIDARDEAPNLFHPYWQARLAPAERHHHISKWVGK